MLLRLDCFENEEKNLYEKKQREKKKKSAKEWEGDETYKEINVQEKQGLSFVSILFFLDASRFTGRDYR